MIQPLGGNTKVYRLFRDPKIVILLSLVLFLLLFIVFDQLSNWKTVVFIENNKYSIISTKAETVQELLKSEKINLGKMDFLNFPMHKELKENMKIELIRVQESLVEVEEKIQCSKKIFKVGILPEGVRKTIYRGENGSSKKIYKILRRDGVEVQKDFIYRRIIKPSSPEIVFEGTGKFRTKLKDDSFNCRISSFEEKNDYPALLVPEGFLPEKIMVYEKEIGKLIIKYHNKRDFAIAGVTGNINKSGNYNFQILK